MYKNHCNMHAHLHPLARLPADFEILLAWLLGDKQRHSLFAFLDATTRLLQPCHHQADVVALQEEMNLALALLERDFPASIQVILPPATTCTSACYDIRYVYFYVLLLFHQVITMHLMHHIAEGIEKFGPVYGTWMYPFERFNSWMCQRALNRAHPEITIMETYRVSCPLRCLLSLCLLNIMETYRVSCPLRCH